LKGGKVTACIIESGVKDGRNADRKQVLAEVGATTE
jgi:hypothetical protein